MDNGTATRSKQATISVAKTRLLTPAFRCDLLTLLTQFEEREARHSREVSEWYTRRESIIDLANIRSREIVEKMTAEVNEYAERVQSEVRAVRNEMEQEQKAWEEEKKRLAHTQCYEPHIKLNVGGVLFSTAIATLRRFPDTTIGTMFSSDWQKLPVDETNRYFIDRDGTHFRHILNFLRDPDHFILELPEPQMRKLRVEADYYGLADYMFPFTSSAEVKLKCDFSAAAFRGIHKNFSMKVVQDDIGMWLGALYPTNNYGVSIISQAPYSKFADYAPIICCPHCSSGIVLSGNLYFGMRNFLRKRELCCLFQPSPSPATPCKDCGKCSLRKTNSDHKWK